MLEMWWGKENTPALMVGVLIGRVPLNMNMVIFSKLGNNFPQDPEIPLLRIYPKDAKSYHNDI